MAIFLTLRFCHMKMVRVHREPFPEPVHPLPKVKFHPEEIPIPIHPGVRRRKPWYRDIRRKEVYQCCSGKLTSSGCTLKWKCCSHTRKIGRAHFFTHRFCFQFIYLKVRPSHPIHPNHLPISFSKYALNLKICKPVIRKTHFTCSMEN